MSNWTSAENSARRRRARIAVIITIAAAVLVAAINVATAAAAVSGATVTCNRQGCSDWQRPAAAKKHHAASHHHQARAHHRQRAEPVVHDANGNRADGLVRSKKTGAKAYVAPTAAPKFQAYIDDLEAHGGAVYYMGGIRAGECSLGSQHPCGWALDVCQDWRGHVSAARDCHLPHPREMAAIAKKHGLYEGSLWCSRPDYGHVQLRRSGSECTARGSWGHGRKRYLATITGKLKVVAR